MRRRCAVQPEIIPSSRPTAGEGVERAIEVLVGQRRGDDRAQPSLVERHGREDDRFAKTPSSNRRAENRIGASESPTMIGVIGVSERPVSKPRRVSSALKRFVLAHRRSIATARPA